MQNKIGKWNIASRIELLLAKIAGHDVDLGTMTPPVASNLTEELLLEIAERTNGGNCGCLLPTPTEEDVGGYIAIEKYAKTDGVIIPEQTVTTVEEYGTKVAKNVVTDRTDLFVDGAKLLVVADGVSYTCTARLLKSGVAALVEDKDLFIAKHDDGTIYCSFDISDSRTEHTIALYIFDGYGYKYVIRHSGGNVML